MKTLRRIPLFALVMAILVSCCALTAFAAPITALPEGYGSFSGTVAEVAELHDGDGLYSVQVEGADGDIAVFVVTPDTCDITGQKPAVGDSFTGWYDLSLPMLMIYPPQYQAAAFQVNLDAKVAVKVDRFDDGLLNTDGELKLHVSENTVILQANGDAFEGGADALAGRALVVLYTTVTQSIPPQTTPEKIFVLYERAVPVPEDIEPVTESVMPILVNGMAIDAPAPYYKGSVLMVPLRAVAEALGYAVKWEAETQSVWLNNIISLTIGKDYYTYARMAPIQLGTAPELVNSTTFVPLSFFGKVARVSDANCYEGIAAISDMRDVDILVNGEKIEAHAPYFKGYELMVPLRAIAEALEYKVTWETETQSVWLNNVISLTIGKDYYTLGRMAPIELGVAPELTDGLTFVPLSFFREVAGMNNAFYFEGTVEINNDEPMA